MQQKKSIEQGLAHPVQCSSEVVNNTYAGSDFTTSKEQLQDEVSSRFRPKKEKTEYLSLLYDVLAHQYEHTSLADVYENKARYTSNCGNLLEFRVSSDEVKLHRASFCKDRLCPMCNWRRSLKIYGQLSAVVDYFTENNPEYEYIFLTLTLRNCAGSDLPSLLDLFVSGWRKLNRTKALKNAKIAGSFRSMEITYNSSTDTFHPHLHAILAVPKAYFARHGNYLSQNDWCELWQQCTGIDYKPIVDVRRVKPKFDNGTGLLDKLAAIREVSKYATKDSDYLTTDLDLDSRLVDCLSQSLSARRLCSFMGCFKDARNALKLTDDIEDGDLIHTDPDDMSPLTNFIIVRMKWKCGVYVEE